MIQALELGLPSLFFGGGGCPSWALKVLTSALLLSAAPGTGGLKFNIQKRPFAVTNQNFSSPADGQHGTFSPQPNPEKTQSHR